MCLARKSEKKLKQQHAECRKAYFCNNNPFDKEEDISAQKVKLV